MRWASRVVERVGRPEYTGENRCLPCTALNVALTAVGSVVLAAAVAGALGATVGALAGATVALAGGAAIYLRGYLVPGTPALTARYFPPWLLRVFGKADGASVDGAANPDADALTDAVGDILSSSDATGMATDAGGDDPDPAAVAAVLADAGAVEAEDGPRLTDGFRSAWRQAVEAVDDPERRVGELVDADEPVELARESLFSDAVAGREGDRMRRVGQWESEAAAVADVAAAEVVAARVDSWGELSDRERGAVLYVLRRFVEFCPACGEAVDPDPATVDRAAVAGCCPGGEAAAVECDACGARLVEVAR